MNSQTEDGGYPILKPEADQATHRRLAEVFWRRKWIVVATVVILTALTAIVSRSLPKEYESTATLWVVESSGVSTFDSVQAGQVLAGTYGSVANNQLLAEKVAAELPFKENGDEVLQAMKFEPVQETQLLKLTATDHNAVRARVIANTYARTFIQYSKSQLGDVVNADITFAAPASVPSGPARPQPLLYTVAGFLISLALGAGLALLAEMLDRRIRSTEELEQLVGAPVLARIPLKDKDPEAQEAFEESFRLLRTNLQFLDRSTLRSLAIVSPSPGDGKSTVAFELAKSFAEADMRVILIEADMRRPSLGAVVGSRGGGPTTRQAGLSDYLSRKSDLSSVLLPTNLPTLHFVSSGLLPPSPSRQFSAERTQKLLSDALQEADLVIVDTPPLSIGAEASTIAASADGALMVIDPKTSNKPKIRSVRQQLAVVGATLLGVVVNRVTKMANVEPYGYRLQPRPSNGSAGRSGESGAAAEKRVTADS
jgi:succinoglycan biosynthesis transport protein ExoP